MLAHPLEVMEHLTCYELDTMISAMDARKSCGILSIELPERLPIKVAGLVAEQPVSGKRGHVHYTVFDEVSNVYRTLIADVLEQKKTKGYADICDIALGLLNLYGCMETEQFIDMVYEKMRRRYRKKTIATFIQSANLFFDGCFVMDYEDRDVEFYASPFLNREDIALIMGRIDSLQDVQRKESFTPEEITSFGQLPYPVFNLPYTEAMETLLHDELECSKKQTQYIMVHLWQQMQVKTLNEEMQNLARRIQSTQDETIEHCFNTLYNWIYSLPLWELKGNARNETHPNVLAQLERKDL